jgi:hypothetical protein
MAHIYIEDSSSGHGDGIRWVAQTSLSHCPVGSSAVVPLPSPLDLTYSCVVDTVLFRDNVPSKQRMVRSSMTLRLRNRTASTVTHPWFFGFVLPSTIVPYRDSTKLRVDAKTIQGDVDSDNSTLKTSSKGSILTVTGVPPRSESILRLRFQWIVYYQEQFK